MKMEQRPKRTGGATVVDFEAYKVQQEKKSVLEQAKETLRRLSDDMLNSASEAGDYADSTTRIMYERLQEIYNKCEAEKAQPGSAALIELEAVLGSFMDEGDEAEKPFGEVVQFKPKEQKKNRGAA